MKRILFLLLSVTLLAALTGCKTSKKAPVTDPNLSNYEVPSSLRGEGGIFSSNQSKEEFRGAWIQTVFQDRYSRMNPQQCREYLDRFVKMLYDTGFNAIIFQVRSGGSSFMSSRVGEAIPYPVCFTIFRADFT